MTWKRELERRMASLTNAHSSILRIAEEEPVAEFLHFLDGYCEDWMADLVVDHEGEPHYCYDPLVMEDLVIALKDLLLTGEGDIILTKRGIDVPQIIIIDGCIWDDAQANMSVEDWKKLVLDFAHLTVQRKIHHLDRQTSGFSRYAQIFQRHPAFTPEMMEAWLEGRNV